MYQQYSYMNRPDSYEKTAESLYPQAYHDIYPHVKRVCQRVDRLDSTTMYALPNKEIIEKMIEEIYDAYRTETLSNQNTASYEMREEYHAAQLNPWGSLIGVILIGELLRRRRGLHPYPYPYPTPRPYPYPYPYYPYR